MHWFYLIGAIVLEVFGTTSMKLSEGFTRPLPSVLIVLFYGGAFVGLTLCLKRMDVSVAYAIWSGVGTALIAVIGFLWFREAVTPLKVASLVMIVLGVIGLNLSGSA